jgi:hypothetical protein
MMKYNFIAIISAATYKSSIAMCNWECGKGGEFVHCGGDGNWHST